MLHRFLCVLLLLCAALCIRPCRAQTTFTGSAPDIRAPRAVLGIHDEPLDLIDIDTLFYIENQGLTRILANLNGRRFKLVTDPVEVRRSANAFLIPQYGEITLNIAAYLHPGDGNVIELSSQGPEGSTAEIIIGDLLLPGQKVAYAITGLQDLPAQFGLLQSYPNPFGASTTITYEIPENRTNGLAVKLAVYDAVGRRVRLLVDEARFPGSFMLVWDGLTDAATEAAPGIYFCHLVAGDVRRTIRMVRFR